MVTADDTKSREILNQLYELYPSNNVLKFGDPIIVNFSNGAIVEVGDIENAMKFANGMKKQFPNEDVDIKIRNSKVVITPKFN